VIDPPSRREPYPGRLPPLRQQWARISPLLRVVAIGAPLLVALLIFLVSVPAGAAVAVMVVGADLATVTYVKNRTDRHNAAVDRGEITVRDDPHLRPESPADLDPDLVERLSSIGYPAADVGEVLRFDGGWLVKRGNRRDVAMVVGDDQGCARFDPRSVTDLWAATEYLAGRGREPSV
jgi:hypothetical protein